MIGFRAPALPEDCGWRGGRLQTRSEYIAGIAYAMGTGEPIHHCVPYDEIDEALEVLHRAGVLPFQAEAKMMAAA